MARGWKTALAAACLAWCVAAAAQSPAETARVLDAAKKEGKVVLYTSAIDGAHNEVVKGFTAKYGIEVEVLEARASEVRERIRAEQAANRAIGDLSLNGSTTTKLQLDEGVFQSHGNMPNAAKVVAPFFADGVRLPAYAWSIGILVNTKLVKPGDEPKSWKDLLDPKWKGKMLSDDYRALGTGAVFFFVTTEKLGTDYHPKLAANAPVFSRDILNDQRRVARGEYPLYITMSMPNSLKLKGLPVKLVSPAEGSPYVRFDLAMMKNAPHPNATRLLMNWFLEEESQLIYARQGFGPTIKGVAEKAPPETKQMMAVKLLGTTDAAKQNDMLSLAKSIYK
jgi:iron(III) transport system substrate-binding protein